MKKAQAVNTMTSVERLALALRLAIDAPEGRESDAHAMVQALALCMSEEEIEAAKALAIQYEMSL